MYSNIANTILVSTARARSKQVVIKPTINGIVLGSLSVIVVVGWIVVDSTLWIDAVAVCVVNAMVGVFVCVTDGSRSSEGIILQ